VSLWVLLESGVVEEPGLKEEGRIGRVAVRSRETRRRLLAAIVSSRQTEGGGAQRNCSRGYASRGRSFADTWRPPTRFTLTHPRLLTLCLLPSGQIGQRLQGK
jgi:hypothetical protein